jgi:tetratricopeptide (TPR) repeat protein
MTTLSHCHLPLCHLPLPVWQLLGDVRLNLGKAQEAVAAYQNALKLAPNVAEAHFGLGNALAAAGRRDEAVDSYCRLLASHPDHAEAMANLGALAELRRLDEAIPILRSAIRLKPTSPRPITTWAWRSSSRARRPRPSISVAFLAAWRPGFL